MAPREATGTFPDQFLTFDYDTAIPLGVAPPHEPMPVANEGESAETSTFVPNYIRHPEFFYAGRKTARHLHPDTKLLQK